MRSEQPDRECNPILNQLNILKHKLDQRGSIIRHLSKELAKQKAVTLEIIEEFRKHESAILSRLQKLEEINIKYIKDYLMLKQRMEIEDFSSTHSIVLGSAEQLYAKKYQQLKEECSKSGPAISASSQNQLLKGFINSCTQLLRTFLREKQPKYEKIMGELREERKRRLKEVKGIDGFKQNLQEQKLIEAINSKTKELNKKVLALDSNNIVEVFNLRTQVEREIAKLNPEKVELAIEESQDEQNIYQQVIQAIIMTNISPDEPQEQIVQQFIMGQYRSLEKGILFYSQKYGKEFMDSRINSLQGLTEQTKASILKNESYHQLMAVKNKYKPRQVPKDHGDQKYPVEYQYEEEERKPMIKKRTIKKIINSKGQEQEYEQIQYQDSDFKAKPKRFHSEPDQPQTYDKKDDLKQGDIKAAHQEQEIEDSSQMLARIQSKKKNEAFQTKTSSKLNNAFETATTKSFFQEQQKARDTLIAKQTTELQEHEKVIDKLITFIKKEFKDKKLEEIEGDDPQQLMGYYFRVNNKKYVDIKEEMKELSMGKKKMEEQFTFLREEKANLQQEKSYLSRENETVKIQNEDLKRKEQKLQSMRQAVEKENQTIKEQNRSLLTQKEELFEQTSRLERDNQVAKQENNLLQEIRNRLEEQKASLEKVMLQEHQELSAVIVERDNLAIKLELQKLEILALSEIYENIKANTKEWQEITVRTQNVVKLSLETLFNTCLNKIKPEELITRLQNLIELIKINMQLKKDMTYELSVVEYVDRQEERVKRHFTMKVNEIITPQASERCEIKLSKVDLRQPKVEQQAHSEQSSQKPKSFADRLQDLAFEIIEKSISSQEHPGEEIPPPAGLELLNEPMVNFNINKSQFEGLNSDILLPLLSFFKPKPPQSPQEHRQSSDRMVEEPEPQEKGLDQNFIDSMMQRIQEMKFSKFTNDEDMKEMFEKYKQALDCLERAQKLNQENEMKYQQFLRDLKSKGAKNSPQSLEDKLFYMERVIATQNQLIQNQRVEFQETIMKQVEKSEELAQDIIKSIKLKRKQTHI